MRGRLECVKDRVLCDGEGDRRVWRRGEVGEKNQFGGEDKGGYFVGRELRDKGRVVREGGR